VSELVLESKQFWQPEQLQLAQMLVLALGL